MPNQQKPDRGVVVHLENPDDDDRGLCGRYTTRDDPVGFPVTCVACIMEDQKQSNTPADTLLAAMFADQGKL